MLDFNTLVLIGVILGVVIAIIINIWLSIYFYKKRYEKNLLSGTIDLINRLDRIEENMDGGNMQEENKKLAKYLGMKIDGLKDELLTELQDIKESLEVLESAIVEGEDDDVESEVGDDDGINDGTFDDVEEEVEAGADSDEDVEAEEEKEEESESEEVGDAEFEAEYNGSRKINIKDAEKRLADEAAARVEAKKKVKAESEEIKKVPKKAWFGKKKGGVVR